MTKRSILFCAVLVTISVNAQLVRNHLSATPSAPEGPVGAACLSDHLRQGLAAAQPASIRREMDMNAVLRQAHGNGQRDGELTIPVVVHIVHVGGDENISDAQVLQGMDDLNAAFNNEGDYAIPDGVVTGIRFCLAQQDPEGMPTSGITRTISGYSNLMAETDDEGLKTFIGWPRTEYLNIWLVAEISSTSMGNGVAGYAYLPDAHGSVVDGIVNEARWFGSTTDNSKVHIHEAGHYLGLYHTFTGGCGNTNCLENGDRVCDTPPDESTAPVSCSQEVNTCTSDDEDTSPNNPFRPIVLGGLGDVPDLTDDYMDYGFQVCQNRFTAGQGERMTAALTEVRESLLESPGCIPGCAGTVAHFNPVPGEVLVGTPWTFTNTSVFEPAHSFEWFVDGTSVSTAADLLHTFTADGGHAVVLHVYNTQEACFDSDSLWIEVGCDAQALFTQVLMDVQPGVPVDFISTSTPAQAYTWSIDGAVVGTSSTLTWTFPEAEGYSVRLIVQGSGCTDTSGYAFVPVGDCVSGENNTLIVVEGSQVSFNSGEAVSLDESTSTYEGYEGVASISDRYGNLLLYSDGIELFNAQHEVIVDSLPGGFSSTQAALFVRKPGSSTRFYLFMTGHPWQVNGGLNYIEVDVTANGGAGGVVGAVVTLLNTTTEKMCAVRHCDGESIWVVGATGLTDHMSAFLITANGVQTTPVVSQTFLAIYNSLGCLKASPRGNLLALANYGAVNQSVMLYNFDNANGTVSIAGLLDGTTTDQQYGVEFSPDGSKLYVTNADDTYGVNNDIYQWDLSSGLFGVIHASKTLIGSSNGRWNLGSMQTGPNGRIYVVMNKEAALGEIRKPNEAGLACEYVDFAVPLAHPTNGFGLSNFVPPADLLGTPMVTGPNHICPGAGITLYYLSCAPGEVNVTHAGPNTLLNQEQSFFRMDIQVEGTDTIFIATSAPCTTLQVDTFLIHVGAPHPDLGNDTTICSTGTIGLDAGPDGFIYQWQDLAGSRYRTFTGPGVYSIVVTGWGNCAGADTIVVSAFPGEAPLELPDPYLICQGYSGFLHGPPGYAHYEWFNGSNADSVQWYGGEGMVWLTVEDAQGCTGTDTTNVALFSEITLDLGPDGTLCPGQVQLLDAGAGVGLTYTWQNNTHEQTFTAYNPGTYGVHVEGCSFEPQQDTITFVPGVVPIVDLGEDLLLCPGMPITLESNGVPGASYLWSDGSNASTLLATAQGEYWLTVVDAAGCYATDSISIAYCTGIAAGDPDGLSIHPNPVSDMLRVTSTREPMVRFELHDATGRSVRASSVNARQFMLERGDMATGSYFLTIHFQDSSTTRKVTLD